jgi:hypothetical protein
MMPDIGSDLARTNEGIAELHIQFSLSCLRASSVYGIQEVTFVLLNILRKLIDHHDS